MENTYFIIIISFFILNFLVFFLDFKDNLQLAVKIYFKSGISVYFIAFGLLVSISILSYILYVVTPDFMHWSWLNLLDKPAGNIGVSSAIPHNNFKYLIGGAILFILLPFAKMEEKMFRENKFSKKKQIIASFTFGLIHLPVGIPIFMVISLSIFGYILSKIYVNTWIKTSFKEKSISLIYKKSLDKVIAIHYIYNMYIVLIIVFIS